MAKSKAIDIINIIGENTGGHCGYCNKDSDVKSSYGFTCEKMKPETYFNLINRGWRRCGSYYYKPFNDSTCCPLYPIRCDCSKFVLSKSQKKVLKQIESFLRLGESIKKPTVTASGDTVSRSITSVSVKKVKKTVSNDKILAGKKDKSKKAKIIRYNLKLEKLKKFSEIKKVSFESVFNSYKERRNKRLEKNRERTLEEYLDYSSLKSAKHSLKLKLVRCHPTSKEFNDTLKLEHELYVKYQIAIHHDKPEDVGLSQFTRFLVDGGLHHSGSAEVVELAHCRRGAPQGQYHQQYWLDDSRLIAVAVVDLMPTAVSSVYFFYDPSFSFLDLGVYSALQEISLVNKLSCQLHDDDFLYYYMGFYIHGCVKMNYKAHYHPSFLSCPVTHRWVPADICKAILDRVKYAAFYNESDSSNNNNNNNSGKSVVLKNCDEHSLANKTIDQFSDLITILIKGKLYKLSKIKTNITPFYMAELETFARLIGSKVLRNITIDFN